MKDSRTFTHQEVSYTVTTDDVQQTARALTGKCKDPDKWAVHITGFAQLFPAVAFMRTMKDIDMGGQRISTILNRLDGVTAGRTATVERHRDEHTLDS